MSIVRARRTKRILKTQEINSSLVRTKPQHTRSCLRSHYLHQVPTDKCQLPRCSLSFMSTASSRSMPWLSVFPEICLSSEATASASRLDALLTPGGLPRKKKLAYLDIVDAYRHDTPNDIVLLLGPNAFDECSSVSVASITQCSLLTRLLHRLLIRQEA